ncbi:MAG: branched-chain-amino-acid transaminase [Thaumarchaeota archaeon]|nr:branched-chain-amino-acid transaminase [Candidatus Calditenuaceae archaeon]MDW8041713.1 branched-chain-amino-acid transaminase [Nitrososphaerota archaeon]
MGQSREPLVYIDGELYPKSQAKVSVFDHGLLYGDGVFEGIRVYDGLIFKLKEHIDRLYNSAKVLRLRIPIDKDTMINDVVKTVRANGFRDAYIRLVVTRGVGDLGLDPRKCERPSVIVIVEHLEPILGKGEREYGVSVIISSTRRDPVYATSHEVKSLNYLNSILAKIEAIEAGADDAIMLDSRGFLSEATGANLFIVRDGKLFTPPVTAGILPGITRAVVIEIAGRLGIPFIERDLTPVELMTADEAFVTGTGAELVPIGFVNKLPINDGRPGPVFKRILEEFNLVKRDPRNGVKAL